MAVPVTSIDVGAYTIPTELPESDGTLQWDSTTIVVVEASAGDETGVGYTYAHESTATLVREKLADIIVGRDALQIGAAWSAMVDAIRNLGRPGIVSTAISAVDVALWDLKARLVGVPVVTLLDAAHDAVPVYGSGGLTSYTTEQVCEQLAG